MQTIKKYIIDFEKLSKLTGDTQAVIAKKLGVSTAKISISKIKPMEYNTMVVNFELHYGKFTEFLKEII